MPPGLRLCVFDSAVEVQEVLPQFSALCRSCIRTFFHFQLVRLYVQKGHAASDCKRFLKRPKRLLSFFGAPLSGYVCVCVSPLVPKGSLPHTLFQPSRGPAADKQTLANKAMLFRWMHSLINCVYLRSTFAQAVLLSFCFMVVLHAIPQNRFPSAVFHCCAAAVTHQHCRTLRLS